MTSVDTHCPYCALQCAMRVSLGQDEDEHNKVAVEPREFPTNMGGLCQKGWTSAALLDSPERITTPLIRIDGEFAPVSWSQALTFVVDKVKQIQSESGKDAVGIFGGGGLTNEKAYQLGKFARIGLGTRFIDYNGRFCMSSAAAAGNRAFGVDRGLPFPVSDIDGASCVLLAGSNVADTMPPFVQHLAGARNVGGLIVIDPRRSATAALTENSGMHLQPLPGTDQILLLGLLHVVVAAELHDTDYLAERTNGSDEVMHSAALWWPERVASITGVSVDQIIQAARTLAQASPSNGGSGAMILSGRGAEQHAQGTDTVTAAINLALALGLPGRPHSGYGCLTGQGNGQGGRELGQKSDQLPGYRMIDDPAARSHMAQIWGVEEAAIPGKGVPAVELFNRLGKSIHGLFVHGANPVVSGPNASHIAERLESLELLVVSDFVMSETAALADVIFPTTQWVEESGTMTSLEGRIIRRRQLLPEPGEARSELWILQQLAQRLGASGFDVEPDRVFDEIAAATKGSKSDYSALSHELLDDESVPRYWPAAEPAGTPRMFVERFNHPDGKAKMVVVEPRSPKDDLRADADIYLITGRVLAQYQSGAQTRRVEALNNSAPESYVQLHPQLAALHDIEEGDFAQVTSVRGSARARVQISDSIRPDTVFMPFHWGGEGCANVVTNDSMDPISGMPEFKVCAVQLSRVETLAEVAQ